MHVKRREVKGFIFCWCYLYFVLDLHACVCVCVFEISVCAGVLGAGGLRSEAKRELCG